MAKSRSGDYKKCTDTILKDIILQMVITLFVNIRAARELTCKTFLDRKYIDRYMINNDRIYNRKKKLEWDNANFIIDHKILDISFITEYKYIADNYTEGKCLCCCV